MTPINRRFVSSILLIGALVLNLLNVNIAFADDGTPPPPPTEEPTQPPTEPPVTEVPISMDPNLIPVEAAPPVEEALVSDLLAELPENTEVVVVNENGLFVPLATQDALQIIEEADPMWCPEGILPNGAGCTTNLTVSQLLALMQLNTGGQFNANGVIYFERSGLTTYNTAFVLDETSLGAASYGTISTYNITLRGAWNGGSSNTFNTSQPSLFDNNNNAVVRVGSSGNPWTGNVTIRDIFVQDNNAVNNPSVAVYTTNGSVSLSDVDTDDIDNSTGIRISVTGTGNVSLTGVDVNNGTDGSGIVITTNSGNISFENVDVDNQEEGNTANLASQSGNINITNGSDFDGDNSGDFNQGFVATTVTGSITINGSDFTDAEGSGAGTNYNGATLSAPVVSLTNVTANDNDLNGIAITNANQITLNNVTATNNGTDITGGTGGGNFSNDLGSGVRVDGNAGSFVSVLDGTFTGNRRYGIEVFNSAIFIGSSIDSCQTTSNSGGCLNVTATTDTSAPSITFVSRSPAANGFGWNISNVTLTWSCADGQSGVVSAIVTKTVTSQGANQSTTGICVNKAGLTTSNTQNGINIDKTAPGISFTSRSPAANGNGWNNSNVNVNWSCTDTLSGMVSGITSQVISTEGANQSSTGTCTDRAGNSASNTQTGINIDKTAPTGVTLTPSGTLGTSGWYTSNVTINTTGTDSISGPVTCTSPQSLSSNSTGTIFNGSCTNLAGLSTNAAPLTVKRDATAPIIAFVSRTPANGSGWNTGNVTVNWSCSDATSGPASAAIGQTVTTEGSNQSSTGTCTDLAGNNASNTQTGINIDKTIPSASASASPAANSNGWNNSNVTVTFTGTDGGSGIASCTPPIALTSEGTGLSATGICTDLAGNVSANATASGITIDKTAPTASANRSPAPNINGWNNSAVTVSFTGADVLSGVDFCSANVVLSTEGAALSASGTCTDKAGNVSGPATASGINIDLTKPTLTLPSTITAEASSFSGAIVNYTASAGDNLDPAPAFNCSTTSGSAFPLGITTVNCSATDQAGNTQTGSFTIVVQDTTPPSISPMANISTTSGSGTGKVIAFASPSTTDAVDGLGVATCTPPSGSLFPVGTTFVTCLASDAAGNISSLTFTIQVDLKTRPAPTPNSLLGGSIIVVTGGEQISLGCFTELFAFGIKLTFHNFCGHQTVITGMDADSLPASLPNGYTFVKGLDVRVLKQGKALENLPDGTGVEFDFPSPGSSTYAVLFWDGTQWIEMNETINDSQISTLIAGASGNELFRIGPTSGGHSKALTTELTGIFVLVKK